MTYGPSPQPGIDASVTLPPLSRAAMTAVVAAAVLVLGTATIGAVLLNQDSQAAGGERVGAKGFTFAPPPGWEDAAGSVQQPAALGGDVVRAYRRGTGDQDRSVIVITAGPPVAAMPDGDQAPGGALEQALVGATRAAGASELGQPHRFTLDGQPALAVDFGAGSDTGRTTGLRVVTLRDGTVYTASVIAPAATYEQDAATFRTLLGGWDWR